METALVIPMIGVAAGIIALRNQDARSRRDAKLALVRSDGGALINAAQAAQRAVRDMLAVCDGRCGKGQRQPAPSPRPGGPWPSVG